MSVSKLAAASSEVTLSFVTYGKFRSNCINHEIYSEQKNKNLELRCAARF